MPKKRARSKVIPGNIVVAGKPDWGSFAGNAEEIIPAGFYNIPIIVDTSFYSGANVSIANSTPWTFGEFFITPREMGVTTPIIIEWTIAWDQDIVVATTGQTLMSVICNGSTIASFNVNERDSTGRGDVRWNGFIVVDMSGDMGVSMNRMCADGTGQPYGTVTGVSSDGTAGNIDLDDESNFSWTVESNETGGNINNMTVLVTCTFKDPDQSNRLPQ